MKRREFITTALACAPACALATQRPTGFDFSKARGFNLDIFYKIQEPRNFRFDDIDFLEANGFNCVRVPFDYRYFVTLQSDEVKINHHEFSRLKHIAAHCLSRNIHLILAMHRAPGYCVNPPYEKTSLWEDAEMQAKFLIVWKLIFEELKDFPDWALSFNAINEPPKLSSNLTYIDLMGRWLGLARLLSPHGRFMIDGLTWGTDEPGAFTESNDIVFGARGYFPMQVSHFQASWVPAKYSAPKTDWPIVIDGTVINREYLSSYYLSKWRTTIKSQADVCVGEWGVFNKTPIEVTIRYMEDCLRTWKALKWGWLLWNFRGPFGIIDSNRQDVDYEKSSIGQIDRKMLALISHY